MAGPALPIAVELRQVYEEARDIAEQTRQTQSTAHVLLALFTVPNHAQVLMADRQLNEDNILAVVRRGDTEDIRVVRELKAKAEQLAVGSAGKEVNCLHLLLAITRIKEAVAYELLVRSGQDVTELRNKALSCLTGRMPRRLEEFRKTSALAVERPLEPLPPLETATASSPPPARSMSELGLAPRPEPQRLPPPRVLAPPRPAPAKGPAKPAAPATTKGVLDPKEFPLLTSLGSNLTQKAHAGGIDPVIGRQREIDQIVDVLGKRRANNALLVGESGVGKTAIVEGLARRLALETDAPSPLKDRVIVELETGTLLAGTQLRGALSERLGGLKEELRKANGKVVVFIDELHTLIGAGATSDGGQDAANELKAALQRGEFPCIGATTPAEHRKHLQQDPAMERRFVVVKVGEPDLDAALKIVEGAAPAYAAHHQVRYEASALRAAVHLSARFIHDRFLPGKAINLLDTAGSRARHQGRDTVLRLHVAEVVSELADVPLDRLVDDDQTRFLHMEDFLGERIVGHRHVIRAVSEAIRRAYAGFSSARPMGSFLFLGPTGVGKTETVKALADFLFGSKEAVVRLDMSEYAEAHAISRLLGSPPGYVGHDEGGQLTDAVRRRPYSIVLLDEIEKAHRDVLLTLLQVLDEGRLTDSKGRTVSFRNAVIIMTSNLGAERFEKVHARTLGFAAAPAPAVGEDDTVARDVLDLARRAVPVELWGRIDERIVFHPLQPDDVAKIARHLLDDSARRLSTERGILFQAGEDVVRFLMEAGGYNARLGARPMRHAVQRHVEALVAEGILAGRFREGDVVEVAVEEGRLATRKAVATAALAPVPSAAVRAP